MGLKGLANILIIGFLLLPCKADSPKTASSVIQELRLQESGWLERLRLLRPLHPDTPLEEALTAHATEELEAGNDGMYHRYRAALELVSLLDDTEWKSIDDYHFGWILWNHRMRSEAKPFLLRALSTKTLSHNERTSGLLMMGYINLEEHQPYEALDMVNRVLARKPNWRPAVELKGLVHRELGTIPIAQ